MIRIFNILVDKITNMNEHSFSNKDYYIVSAIEVNNSKLLKYLVDKYKYPDFYIYKKTYIRVIGNAIANFNDNIVKILINDKKFKEFIYNNLNDILEEFIENDYDREHIHDMMDLLFGDMNQDEVIDAIKTLDIKTFNIVKNYLALVIDMDVDDLEILYSVI